MAIIYFGNNDNGNDSYAVKSMYWLVAGYVCPGSGAQELRTLDINVNTVITGQLRGAIYNSGGGMIAQWNTPKTPVSAGWLEVTSFVDFSGDPVTPQLTGGQTYFLAVAGDAGNAHLVNLDGGQVAKYASGVYVDSMPENLPSGSSGTREYCIRCGVEPAGGTAYTLDADPGAFTLSGQPSSLLAGRNLPAEAGPFSLSGQGAAFLRGRVLAAGAGALTLSGQSAALLRSYLLDAAAGPFVLTGQAADLVYGGGPTAYTLIAEPGAFTLAGQQALLLRGLRLPADPGAFALTGQPAAILRGYRLITEAGTFALSGQAAALLRNYLLEVEPGVFVLTGQAARLLYSGEELTTITILLDLSPVTEIVLPQPVTEAALEGTPVTEIRL